MKRNGISIIIQISFLFFIPLIKTYSHTIKLKVNSSGPVKILNKEKITGVITPSMGTISDTDNILTIDDIEGEVILSLDGTLSNYSLLFAGMTNIIEIDFSGLNTNTISDMRYMFKNCTSLKSIKFTGLNTVSVKSIIVTH